MYLLISSVAFAYGKTKAEAIDNLKSETLRIWERQGYNEGFKSSTPYFNSLGNNTAYIAKVPEKAQYSLEFSSEAQSYVFELLGTDESVKAEKIKVS